MNEFYGEDLVDKFVEKYGDKITKVTLNSYKKEVEQLKKDNKLLECAINELMIQCDIKYFRFIDKEFYKQESPLSFISDKN